LRLTLPTALCAFALTASVASSQGSNLNRNAPGAGSPAPELAIAQLLQAPPGSKVDWASLRGKVVVLEFWATWCAPCVAEIPVLNALVAAVDPQKVQFVSISDEDAAVVEAFLKKKATAGWIGVDAAGETFKRYGVEARPTTVIIDAQGRVASTTVSLEYLKTEQLLALAKGEPVTFGGDADPKLQAMFSAAMAKGSADEAGEQGKTDKPLFQISLRASALSAEAEQQKAHVQLGVGRIDITDAPVSTLLQYGAGVAPTRIVTQGDIPKTAYDLRVVAPDADAKMLAQAVELAISSGAGVRIEHRTAVSDAYALTANAEANQRMLASSFPGMAVFHEATGTLQCINASADQLASALEKALGMPVVNETGLTGKLKCNLKLDPKNLNSINETLKGLGFALERAKRPVETVVVSGS